MAMEVLSGREIGDELQQLASRASERVLVTTWSLGPKVERGPLAGILERSKDLPEDVCIVVDFDFRFGVHVDVRSLRRLIERLGHERVRRHRGCHAKLFVADGVAIVGSANLSQQAFSGTVWEIALRTADPCVVGRLVKHFRAIARESDEITEQDLRTIEHATEASKGQQPPEFAWRSPSEHPFRFPFEALADTEFDVGDAAKWRSWTASHPNGYMLNFNAGTVRIHRVGCPVWQKERLSFAQPHPAHVDRQRLETAAKGLGRPSKQCQRCLRVTRRAP